eukprot:4197763-Pleurochrysis_carterae.AAC.1
MLRVVESGWLGRGDCRPRHGVWRGLRAKPLRTRLHASSSMDPGQASCVRRRMPTASGGSE